MSRPAFSWGSVVLAVALLAGCAAQQRENYVRDRAAEHVYAQPLEEMWPQVKAVLEDKGYSWREIPQRFILETEWKENGGGTLGNSYTRFLIEGMRVRGGGAVLRVMRNDASSQPTAVHYAGTVGPVSSARAANEAMVNASNSNTTGMTPLQKRAFRDLELELELLQVIDPDAAASLEAQALAKYPKK
ncbi:hypothetical protein [Hyalangium minutum]|uniref:hypothetical protein n=1 Tax=Hyalangium minutum TaxID=394096 RepID=UPI0007C6BE56|nr:hypothetical protein [Hyalangium minutum]